MSDSPTHAVISIYPEEGSRHSSISALAGYSKNLFECLPDSHRNKTTILTNIKGDGPRTFMDTDMLVQECWKKGSLGFWSQIIKTIKRQPTIKTVHLQHEFNQFGSALTVLLIPWMLFCLRVFHKKKVLITFHEVISQDVLTPGFVKSTNIPIPAWAAKVIFNVYYRIACSNADIVITQAEHFQSVLETQYKVRKQMEIIRIGSRMRKETITQDQARQKLGIDQEARTLLFFGMIDWRKGLDLLLDAFEQLPDENYRLLIVGGPPNRIKDTPDYKAWHDRIQKRINTIPGVTATGYVASEDIETYFRASDLVVLPYIVPQLVSAVLTMALSYDRPFIGSDVFTGTVDDIFLFKQSSTDFSDKINWSFNTGMNDLNTHCVKLRTELSWEKSARKMSELYTKLASE